MLERRARAERLPFEDVQRARVARVVFPREQVAAVKAVACELPVRNGLALSRFSRTELDRLVI